MLDGGAFALAPGARVEPTKANRYRETAFVPKRSSWTSLFRAHRVVNQHLDRQKMGNHVTAVVPVMLVRLSGPVGIFGTG